MSILQTRALTAHSVPYFIVTALTLAAMALFALSAYAAEIPTMSVGIQNSVNATSTSQTIGAIVSDKVIIGTASTTLPTPTGTVDFSLYQNTSCSGTPTTQAGVPLATGGIATSATTVVPASGLSYKVRYNGQGDVFSILDSACQTLTATKAQAVIATTLSTTSILAGSFVHDSANLSGVTTNATGTVTYTHYTDSACSLNATNAGTVTVANGIIPDSLILQFSTPGTYNWRAAYSGDMNNTSASSICGTEVLSVSATSTPRGHLIVTKQTVPANDATTFHFVTSGAGYANFDLSSLSAPNDQTLTVGSYSLTETALAGWAVTSASCGVNGLGTTTYTQGATLILNANDTIRCLFVNTKTATTTTGNGVINGLVFNDANRNHRLNSGEVGLSGWTINLFNRGRWGINGSSSGVVTTVSDSNGNFSFGNLSDGMYRVTETVQSGWKQTTNRHWSVRVRNGVARQHVDFGNFQLGQTGSTTPPVRHHDDEDRGDDGDHKGGDRGSASSTFGNGFPFNFKDFRKTIHRQIIDSVIGSSTVLPSVRIHGEDGKHGSNGRNGHDN